MAIIGGMLHLNAQSPGVPYQAYIINSNSGIVPGKNIDVPLVNKELRLQFTITNSIGDEEYISLYSYATKFSAYVIKLFQTEKYNELKKAFDEIEILCLSKSHYISEVAHVGFVEGILMLRSHKGISLDAFDSYLGESSKEFWYEMHDFFTSGKSS